MALKAVVTDLSEVDESLHEHYTEKDGIFYLALDEFGKHPGAVTLKTTLNKVNKDKEALAAKVTELEGKVESLPEDFDADEWERLKAGDGGKPDEAIQVLKDQHARAMEALKNKYAKEISEMEKAIQERDSYIDRSLIDGGLKDALLEVGVNPDLMDGAVASLRAAVKVQRGEDGSRAAVVETDLGEVPVAEFVKEWSATKGKAYLGKASGPDAHGNNGTGRIARGPAGDFGGDKTARVKAIASKFPELAQN